MSLAKVYVAACLGTKMKVQFFYTDIDNSLYTSAQASVVMEIHADDLVTAHILAEKLMVKLGADKYTLDE